MKLYSNKTLQFVFFCLSAVLCCLWAAQLTAAKGQVVEPNGLQSPGQDTIESAPSEPNGLSQPDQQTEEENDSFTPKLSTLVVINEAYERIFTPDLITDDGLVRYATLRRLRNDLVTAMRELKTLHPAVLMKMSKEEKIAFWLNTYNACTLQLVIDNYPIQPKWYMILYPDNSIMQLDKPWTRHFFWISQEQYTLQEIRQELLLDRYKDPRLCFALSYAARGGAALRNEPYRPQTLDSQLNDQVKKFLSRPDGLRLDKNSNILYLSNVFALQENKKTFLESEWAKVKKFRQRKDEERAWLNFIVQWLPEEDIRYLETAPFTIKFLEYDWHLNELR
ncbi:MAG: DUF547 domain-containing protein [Phycisphaerae bacterium]|nr:DUF547 domain-containing protein [Phycisphaerae bacterium]